MSLSDFRHPFWTSLSTNWEKWRLTSQGGDAFIRRYLEKCNRRETAEDYKYRLNVTYCPAFAKAELKKIRNAIYRRFNMIQRFGGPKSYVNAVPTNVDRANHSMSDFLGAFVLPELLSMARVGVYVDMPPLSGPTMAHRGNATPYLYTYTTEQIESWHVVDGELMAVVLNDCNYGYDDTHSFPTKIQYSKRKIWKDETGVHVQFFGKDENGVDTELNDVIDLQIPKIPLVILEISESLLVDAANYQIALLNLESSEMFYALRSSFPFYVEMFDPRGASQYLKDTLILNSDGSQETNEDEIHVGPNSGRRYPLGTERPSFIHPSPEPLKASMEKARQIKADIEYLISLALSNLQPTSSGSVLAENVIGTADAGLAYIGLVLETAERQIAEIWADYEQDSTPASISYPKQYSLKTEAERLAEIKEQQALLPKIPSKTAQREICKIIASSALSERVSIQVLEKIKAEIDNAEVIIVDPDVIKLDLENGLVSVDLASKARGYPEGQVEQAKQDHSERLARIAIAQTPGMGAAASRGIPEADPNPAKSPAQEKAASRDTTRDGVVTDKTRGQGK